MNQQTESAFVDYGFFLKFLFLVHRLGEVKSSLQKFKDKKDNLVISMKHSWFHGQEFSCFPQK